MKFYIMALVVLLILGACSWNEDKNEIDSVLELNIPDNFDFSLEQQVELQIALQSNQGEPLAGIVYQIYYYKYSE